MAWLAVLALAAQPAAAGVLLEDMTSPELRARVQAGASTVLLPIGGTEQNGPHLALGKHNLRVSWLARQIAERLGDALVAPVMAYVPEGQIQPPSGHMRWAGTLSIPEAAFEAVLEASARSLCQHGLRRVVLLGDHGGYQASLARVAARFTTQTAPGCQVLAPPAYYRAASKDFAALLAARGFSATEIGQHAGLADTALSMAVDMAMLRPAQLPTAASAAGVRGDPRRATAELGRLGLALIVDATVAALQDPRAGR